MFLVTYNCLVCIENEEEILSHLFFSCPFSSGLIDFLGNYLGYLAALAGNVCWSKGGLWIGCFPRSGYRSMLVPLEAYK